MTETTSTDLGESLGTDFFSVRERFTDEQWTHFITVRKPRPARTAAAAGARSFQDTSRGLATTAPSHRRG